MAPEAFLMVKRMDCNRVGVPLFLSDIVTSKTKPFRWSPSMARALRFEVVELPELLDIVRHRKGYAVLLVRGSHVVTICERHPGDRAHGQAAKLKGLVWQSSISRAATLN